LADVVALEPVGGVDGDEAVGTPVVADGEPELEAEPEPDAEPEAGVEPGGPPLDGFEALPQPTARTITAAAIVRRRTSCETCCRVLIVHDSCRVSGRDRGEIPIRP